MITSAGSSRRTATSRRSGSSTRTDRVARSRSLRLGCRHMVHSLLLTSPVASTSFRSVRWAMEGISLRPSDAQAGGFLDDADVVLKECRFVRWDYAGKAPESVALKVTMEDHDARIHEQYYSAGDPKKITPSADGRAVVGVESSPGGLTSSTNAVAFITSLVNAGVPGDSVTNDGGVFDGMAVHVNQVAQPKRVGLKDAKENKTYLLVTKILRMPGEGGPPQPAQGAPAPQQKAGPRPVPANAVPTPTPSPAPVPGAEPSAD